MPAHDELITVTGTGVNLSRLGLGTAPLGGLYSHVPAETAVDVITTAVQRGVRYIDTAPGYGFGTAEQRLGEALSLLDHHGLAVSTKVGKEIVETGESGSSIFVGHDSCSIRFDFSPSAVRRSVESSLGRLGLSSLDMVFLHDADSHETEALEWAYPELERMRREGLVKAIGIGMNSTRIPTRFICETDIDVVLLAGRFTLLDQQALDNLLPAALERGVDVIAGGVFNSGVLADPSPGSMYNYRVADAEIVRRAQLIKVVLEGHGVRLTAAALQFPLRHPAIKAVLTGVRNVSELEQNIRDFTAPIPDDCWYELYESGLVRQP